MPSGLRVPRLRLTALAALFVAAVAPFTASGPALAADTPTESDGAGCARLNDSGRFAESLPRCLAAVAAARMQPDDRANLAAALNGAGFALEMTGDRPGAERSYLEALAIQRELRAADQEALVLSNLAALAIGAGDYGRALELLAAEESVALAAAARGKATWVAEELRITRLNRGVALEQLGAYREALVELRHLAAGPEPDPEHAAALEVNLAVLYRNLGDPRRALRLLDSAAAAYGKLGDRAALANVHLNRALALAINLDDPAAARAELERALALARSAGDRAEELRALQAAGELELGAAGIPAARQAFEAALEIARLSGARTGEASALAALGRVARAAGERERALALLAQAEAIFERASREVGDPALGDSLRRDQRLLYAVAVDLLGEKATAAPGGDRAAALEALAWSERLKARELLDALAGGTTLQGVAPLPAPELERLAGSSGPTLITFIGERRLWLWTNGARGWSMRDAGEAGPILAATRRIHIAIARGGEPGEADLAALGSALLADLPAGATLRVVPDGLLHYLPITLLPDPGAPGRRIVDSRAVRTVPSLSVLARLRSAPLVSKWRFAALAAPERGDEVESPAAGGAAALLARRLGLPPLPGSAREATDAAARLGPPAVVDIGRDATERHLFERGAEGARVLHVAAHTLVDESVAEGVAIVLAPEPAENGEKPDRGDGNDRDGFVTPAELARAKISADLVVLSGCRTALPADERSATRALASLSGAFFAAGARAVVASLWEVGDEATAALMEQLYFELAAGVDAAEALRRAQARMAADPRWNAPHRWAGFVLAGEPAALESSRRVPAPLFAGAALVAGGAALWFIGRRRTRSNGEGT